MAKKLTPELEQEIRRMHREGKSCRTIADQLGIAHDTVWNHVSHDNISMKLASKPAVGPKSVVNALPMITSQTKITVFKTTIPDHAPVRASTSRGIYKGAELHHRGRV